MKIYLILLILLPFSLWGEEPTDGKISAELQTQVLRQEDVQEDLSHEKASAEKMAKEAESRAASAKEQANKAETETEKALADFLSNLQQYKASVAQQKLDTVNRIQEKISDISAKTEVLKKYERKIKEEPDRLEPIDLEQVSQIWSEIVDDTIHRLFVEDSVNIDPPPTRPSSVELDGEKYFQLKQEIEKSLETVKNSKVDAEKLIAELKKSQRDLSAKLLLNAGRVRAAVMGVLIDRDKYSVWTFNNRTLANYTREIQVVPYRFVATFEEKFYDFKVMSQQGVEGWLAILKQGLLLLFVLLLPFFLFKAFRLFSAYLENLRRQIFTNSQMDYKNRTRLALLIGRLNPYLPWVFAFIAIRISYNLLLGTLLEPVTLFLPYLSIYVLYRGFLILFSGVLGNVLLSRSLDKLRNMQSKVEATAFKLSVLFFVEWGLLKATEDAVRQALIYNLVFDIIIYLNLLIVALEARHWRSELLELSSLWLKPNLQKRLANVRGLIFELILFPLLFMGNLVFMAMSSGYRWLGQFELGKKVSSEIFKKRLEDATDGDEQAPISLSEEYRSLFQESDSLDPKLRISLSRSPFQKCINLIEGWRNGTSHEDLILLYGNYGIGKTTILNAIEKDLSESLRVVKISITGKLTTKGQLFKLLSESLGMPLQSADDMEKLDDELERTLIIIDNIHNLYLNSIDGLNAYRELIELTTLQLKNVFWCLACNERALSHLNGLFGYDHFIGQKLELLSWTDTEIQELILKRHRLSKFRLVFDQVISAVHRGDILEASSGLEVQFFRLLWGQSRGNPSTAQELWLSAARKSSGDVIRITVPAFTNPRTLADLSDETLMVYTAIVKHENLSFAELEATCNLPLNTIRQALKFGEDGMILEVTDQGRWRIHPKAQYVVHAQLSGRNLIYG